MRQFWTIVHFQFALSLCFKARLSSKPLIWKFLFVLTQIKLVLTTKNCHLVSFFQTRKWSIELFGCGGATKHLLQFWKKKNFFHFNFPHFFPVCKTASFKTFSRIQDSVQTLTFGKQLTGNLLLFLPGKHFLRYLSFLLSWLFAVSTWKRERSKLQNYCRVKTRMLYSTKFFKDSIIWNSLPSLKRSEFG